MLEAEGTITHKCTQTMVYLPYTLITYLCHPGLEIILLVFNIAHFGYYIIRQHIIKGKANDIHTRLIHLRGYLGKLLILKHLICVSLMALYIELWMLAEPLDKGDLGLSGHRELFAPEGTGAILLSPSSHRLALRLRALHWLVPLSAVALGSSQAPQQQQQPQWQRFPPSL